MTDDTIPTRSFAQEVIATELCRIRGLTETTDGARNDADAILTALAQRGLSVEVAG